MNENEKKNIFIGLIFILIIALLIFKGCSNDNHTNSLPSSNLSNGQSLTLSKDTPVCSSKANVDKLISFLDNNNSSAINQMEINGEARILKSGTKVNVINIGIVTEVETSTGEHWYAPYEVIK